MITYDALDFTRNFSGISAEIYSKLFTESYLKVPPWIGINLPFLYFTNIIIIIIFEQ